MHECECTAPSMRSLWRWRAPGHFLPPLFYGMRNVSALEAALEKPTERIATRSKWLRAKDALHFFTLGEFVYQFIEVADLPHERVADFFYAHATYNSGNA